MKEKELKIKQKSDFIKTRKREIFDIKEKPVNLFNNRLKSDLIKKTVTEKKEQAEIINSVSDESFYLCPS